MAESQVDGAPPPATPELDVQFQANQRDDGATRRVLDALKQGKDEGKLSGVSVSELECRGDVCRMKLAYPDYRVGERALHELFGIGGVIAHGMKVASRSDDPSVPGAMVVYFGAPASQ